MHPSSTSLTREVMISPSTLPSLDERSSWKVAGDAIPKLKPELPDSWEALKLTVHETAPESGRSVRKRLLSRAHGIPSGDARAHGQCD